LSRTPSDVANLDDVAEFAKSLPTRYLICRVNNRHIADPDQTTVDRPTRDDPRWIVKGPCLICKQPVRKRYDEEYGRVSTTAAVGYKDDYLRPKGSGRIDANGRRILVGELIERTTGAAPKRRKRSGSATVTPIRPAKAG
jgi:hypothetical protein